jgi:hypothetical protein
MIPDGQSSIKNLHESGGSTRPEFVSSATKTLLTGRRSGLGADTPLLNRGYLF